MDYIAAAISDIGSKGDVNQDALLVRSRICSMGNVCIGVICDGMGGLFLGEVASSHVIKRLSDWFSFRAGEIKRFDKLVYYLEKEINHCSKEIYEYGRKHQMMIGTTVTVFVTMGKQYAVLNVGDSRAYKLEGRVIGRIKQLTTDQSVDDYMLTQAVGTSESVKVEIVRGRAEKDDVYLLCTDGFRHKNDNTYIKKGFNPQSVKEQEDMERNLKIYVDRARKLGEKDDISALVIKLL